MDSTGPKGPHNTDSHSNKGPNPTTSHTATSLQRRNRRTFGHARDRHGPNHDDRLHVRRGRHRRDRHRPRPARSRLENS